MKHNKRVAIIGSGIAGLAAAHALSRRAEVTLYEADTHFGGHAHTVDVTLEGVTHGVDTGFLVYNERTYPGLIRLFAELGVPTAPSDMSFSVQSPSTGLEWSGSSLNSVFAQRRNLVRPSFWWMLRDILRFNRLTTALAQRGADAEMAQSIADFLDEHHFGAPFRDGYLMPMIGCIWSCPTEQMLRFPIATLIRFCHNHGLLQVSDRPQWFTVQGGSREYVRRIVAALPDARLNCPVRAVRRLPPGAGNAGVWVRTDHGSERFDDVILACHTDQALAMIDAPTRGEAEVLGAIRYQHNEAVLHTDTALLPRRPLAWAAWNYERAADVRREQAQVCLHYLINRLQPLPWHTPVVVSLNPVRPPAPALVLGRYDYAHPVFDLEAIGAQRRLGEIQGSGHLWFAGAWTRYGFHEDGLQSGLAAAESMLAAWASTGEGEGTDAARAA